MTTATKELWETIPFSYLGINFHSRFLVGSEMYHQIKIVGDGRFIEMNLGALASMTDIKANSKLSFIQSELDKVNHGGTYAFLELGQDN